MLTLRGFQLLIWRKLSLNKPPFHFKLFLALRIVRQFHERSVCSKTITLFRSNNSKSMGV